MLILTYTGTVTDGQLKLQNHRRFLEECKQFEGKQVELTLRRKQSRRSDQQNRYYWGAVVPIVAAGLCEAGYRVSEQDTHVYLKSRFLLDGIVNENTGEILPTTGSTSKLSTTDFMAYVAEIQQWAAEFLNVVIPDPGEQVEIEFKP
jgi:hypothetical protein